MKRLLLTLFLVIGLIGSSGCIPDGGTYQGIANSSQDVRSQPKTPGGNNGSPLRLDDRWGTGIVRNDLTDPMIEKATKDAKKALETNLELYYNSGGQNQTSPNSEGLDGERN